MALLFSHELIVSPKASKNSSFSYVAKCTLSTTFAILHLALISFTISIVDFA